MSDTTPEVKEFTSKKGTADITFVPFTLDGETYHAYAIVPGQVVLDVAALNGADGLQQARIVLEFLGEVLTQESAERIAVRLTSKDNPLDIETAIDIAVYLMEEVVNKGRPTAAPSQSPNGSKAIGDGSADGASLTAGTQTQTPGTHRIL